MAFSAEKARNHKQRKDSALIGGRLDPWQAKFLTDIRTRIDKNGTKTRLSENQLTRIYESIGGKRPLQRAAPGLHNLHSLNLGLILTNRH